MGVFAGFVRRKKMKKGICNLCLCIGVLISLTFIHINTTKADVCFLPESDDCGSANEIPYCEGDACIGGHNLPPRPIIPDPDPDPDPNGNCPDNCYSSETTAQNARVAGDYDSYYVSGNCYCMKKSCSGSSYISGKGSGWNCSGKCTDSNSLNYNKYTGCTAKQCTSPSSTTCQEDECHTCKDATDALGNKLYSGDTVCKTSTAKDPYCPDGYSDSIDSSVKCYDKQNKKCGTGTCYRGKTQPTCGANERLSHPDGVCTCVTSCQVKTCGQKVTVPANGYCSEECTPVDSNCNNGEKVCTDFGCNPGYKKENGQCVPVDCGCDCTYAFDITHYPARTGGTFLFMGADGNNCDTLTFGFEGIRINTILNAEEAFSEESSAYVTPVSGKTLEDIILYPLGDVVSNSADEYVCSINETREHSYGKRRGIINSVRVYNHDGKRVCVGYYDKPTCPNGEKWVESFEPETPGAYMLPFQRLTDYKFVDAPTIDKIGEFCGDNDDLQVFVPSGNTSSDGRDCYHCKKLEVDCPHCTLNDSTACKDIYYVHLMKKNDSYQPQLTYKLMRDGSGEYVDGDNIPGNIKPYDNKVGEVEGIDANDSWDYMCLIAPEE